jgi:hypothetical protein
VTETFFEPYIEFPLKQFLKSQENLATVNWQKKLQEETSFLVRASWPKSEMRIAPSEVDDILSLLDFTLSRVMEPPPYHYGAILTK